MNRKGHVPGALLGSANAIPDNSCYRPQRSCGQGNVFTGVCLSTGGRVSASVHAGMPYPPGTGQSPPGPGRPPRTRQTPPEDQADPLGPGRPLWELADIPLDQADPPPQEADSSIRSTSGRYASYWNAFLYFINVFSYGS